MTFPKLLQYLFFLMFLFGITVLTSPAIASVKYIFVVSEHPTETFFTPLSAEITLSDAAVSAGTATKGQIESVVFGGGSTMEEENRITLSYLHGDFIDLTVTLSADRKTITALNATLKTSNTSIDSWVFHYQNPEHPTLDIHEFVGILKKDRISLETTILPVPPTHHHASFTGEWQRKKQCWFIARYLCKPVTGFPICWIDLVFLSIAALIGAGVIIRIVRNRKP